MGFSYHASKTFFSPHATSSSRKSQCIVNCRKCFGLLRRIALSMPEKFHRIGDAFSLAGPAWRNSPCVAPRLAAHAVQTKRVFMLSQEPVLHPDSLITYVVVVRTTRQRLVDRLPGDPKRYGLLAGMPSLLPPHHPIPTFAYLFPSAISTLKSVS